MIATAPMKQRWLRENVGAAPVNRYSGRLEDGRLPKGKSIGINVIV
jgi:hypothetical protein